MLLNACECGQNIKRMIYFNEGRGGKVEGGREEKVDNDVGRKEERYRDGEFS